MDVNTDTKIFISYFHKEVYLAELLHEALVNKAVDQKIGGSNEQRSNTAPKVVTHLTKSLTESECVFYSQNTLFPGVEWLTKIRHKIDQCKVVIAICSPDSIKRPWLLFELGSAIQLNKPLIAFCHSGIKAEQLPSIVKTHSQLYTVDMKSIDSFISNQNHGLESSNEWLTLGLDCLQGLSEPSKLININPVQTKLVQKIRSTTRIGNVIDKSKIEGLQKNLWVKQAVY